MKRILVVFERKIHWQLWFLVVFAVFQIYLFNNFEINSIEFILPQFTTQNENVCTEVEKESMKLEEIRWIPLDESIQDQSLFGWEDDWISKATFSSSNENLEDEKIDLVYEWVNGSDPLFSSMKNYYQNQQSLLSLSKNSENRYRNWDELRHSIRSVKKFLPFVEKILLMVNSVPLNSTWMWKPERKRQTPNWMVLPKGGNKLDHSIQIYAQEEFFSASSRKCLPVFNSVSMESQIHLLKGSDKVIAISDDMLFAKNHTSSDFYSSLFGINLAFDPRMEFNGIEVDERDDNRGQKGFSIFTSYYLNRRFGERLRKIPVHFGKVISKKLLKEAFDTFPRMSFINPSVRFRGSSPQISPWFLYQHYIVERFREACLWSYLVLKSDLNGDGILQWNERQEILRDVTEGMSKTDFPKRTSIVKDVNVYLNSAGLLNATVSKFKWTSVQGPWDSFKVTCELFNVNCIMENFQHPNKSRFIEEIFQQVTMDAKCGDCLLQFALKRVKKGLEPILPPKERTWERSRAVKALIKYQYSIVNPKGIFIMMKTPPQVYEEMKRIRRGKHGQICLNDDVKNEEHVEVIREMLIELYQEKWGEETVFEKK